MSILLVSWRDI